jgi:hypothetical protein
MPRHTIPTYRHKAERQGTDAENLLLPLGSPHDLPSIKLESRRARSPAATRTPGGPRSLITNAKPLDERASFRLWLIAAHLPKLSRPFDESPFPRAAFLCRHCRVGEFVDLISRQVGGFRSDLWACLFPRVRARKRLFKQAADGLGARGANFGRPFLDSVNDGPR